MHLMYLINNMYSYIAFFNDMVRLQYEPFAGWSLSLSKVNHTIRNAIVTVSYESRCNI